METISEKDCKGDRWVGLFFFFFSKTRPHGGLAQTNHAVVKNEEAMDSDSASWRSWGPMDGAVQSTLYFVFPPRALCLPIQLNSRVITDDGRWNPSNQEAPQSAGQEPNSTEFFFILL